MEDASAPSTPSKAAIDPEAFAWTPSTIRAVAEAYIADAEARRTGPTYLETLDAFTNFLTAYIHTLLYLRNLYPKTSFLHVRFHNTSAYQSRHPFVCEWVHDAIEAVREELFLGTVSRIGVVIFSYGNGKKNDNGGREGSGDVQIMERYMVDVSAFPIVHPDNLNNVVEWESSGESSEASSPDDELERDDEDEHGIRGGRDEGRSLMFGNRNNNEEEEELGEEDEEPWMQDEEEHEVSEVRPHAERTIEDEGPHEQNRAHKGGHMESEEDDHPRYDINLTPNLAEQMRASLISLTTRAASLKPLPPRCSFNICMELRDEADIDPPTEHPQHWVPVQPSMQKTGRSSGFLGESHRDKRKRGEDLDAMRYTPIRTVETGAFRFETWVEEGPAKFKHVSSSQEGKVKFGSTTSSDEQNKTGPTLATKEQSASKQPIKSSETPRPKSILKNKDTPSKSKVSFSSSDDTTMK